MIWTLNSPQPVILGEENIPQQGHTSLQELALA